LVYQIEFVALWLVTHDSISPFIVIVAL